MELPATRLELPGWELFWAGLAPRPEGVEELAALRHRVAEEARAALRLEQLAAHPTVAAMRRLFRAAGCDPTRYRPSSEALLRRLLPAGELPAIDALVDLNNCLSVALRLPCCVLDAAALRPPVTLRAGCAGELLDSMRGPLDLAGKPLLADRDGPFGTPITDSHRVKVRAETAEALLVVYLPAGEVSAAKASGTLDTLLAAAPAAYRTA